MQLTLAQLTQAIAKLQHLEPRGQIGVEVAGVDGKVYFAAQDGHWVTLNVDVAVDGKTAKEERK